jgi:hypothetical protein|tara:strand:- start:16 stop:438 length:423 start_codon:yes stop_codon:yes gene_type:complete
MEVAEEERKGGQTSAEALAAVEQIMDLEGMTRDCLQRLDDLERVVALERKKVELEEGMEEKAGVDAADPIAPAPVGRSSVADIDAQIAAVKAEALERQKRDTIAKARFEETKGSIERGEAHIANIELMSVQTPEGQAALE